MLTSAYIRVSLGGTLEIIDIDNQYAIWSYNNYGCIGLLGFFSRLDGDDCLRLDKVANSTYLGYPLRSAEACGTENNSVKVEKNGGDKSVCKLDKGLKYSSRYTALDLLKSSTELSSTEPSSTKSSSTKSSSALITPNSSLSVSKLSLTTF
ncbi:hypothetical protein N7449_005046 [Penicillium cf. viridicatum]|uniref:Uncharacterized protein n=1 Tax=Penicillium cf. viridicatum TaxID=2972119 RepID=A0A9W9SYQ8_9EURO|nr:hypothetical protein N7449_005046 [Penicillium cf. viridicatum]